MSGSRSVLGAAASKRWARLSPAWGRQERLPLPVSQSVCLSIRPPVGAPVPFLVRSRSPAGACPWSVSVRALCLQMYIFKRDLNRLFPWKRDGAA